MTRHPASGPRLRHRTTIALTIARLAVPYVLFAGLKYVVPVATLARLAWRDGAARNRPRERRAITAVTWLRRLGGADRGDCLQAALVLYRELSRAGTDPQLVMGFRTERTGTTGHAWVEVEGRPVQDAPAGPAFVRTVAFGARGMLQAVSGRGR